MLVPCFASVFAASRRLALGLALLGGALAPACATQREQRITAVEARQRPSDEPCAPPGAPPTPDSSWSCGYWHWDSVRYVWIDGKWSRR